jgi:NADH-quinone oxidoreductase subunit G
METAIDTLRARLAAVVARHGPQAVALLGSPRASLEANVLLRDWAQTLGTTRLAFDAHADQDRAARISEAYLERHACSLNDVRHSDLAVLVGTDPLAEGPLLALAIRQAVRGGGRVVAVAPQPIELPCRFTHLPVAADHLGDALAFLAGGAPGGLTDADQTSLTELRTQLAAARRPILAGGGSGLGSGGINTLFKAAEALSTAEKAVGVMVLLHGPNSYAGAMLAGRGPNFDMLLDGIEEGRIHALVCLESDPCRDARDPVRARQALGRLDLLAALDALPTETAGRATLFLPTRTVVEADGSFVNNEGRLQAFAQVMEPGLPLRETSPEVHPPREFFRETPGCEPWPAWRILARLLGRSEELAVLRREIADLDPRFAPLAVVAPDTAGIRLATTPGLPHYQLGQETPG